MASRGKREVSVEDALRVGVEALGGICIKLYPAWYVGIPDRLVLLPGARVFFVELKRPVGGVVSSSQKWWARTLTRLGFQVRTLNTVELIETFLNEL